MAVRVLQLLAGLALLVLLAGRALRLRRTPGDRALRALTASLGLLLLVEPLPGLPTSLLRALLAQLALPERVALGLVAGVHVLWMLCLKLFFTYSAHPPEQARRQARRDTGLAAAVVAVLAGCAAVLPHGPIPAADTGLAGGGLVVGTLVYGGYSVAMMAHCGGWSWRYSREVTPRMRPGPQVGAVGLWIYGLGCGVHTAAAVTDQLGSAWPLLATTMPAVLATGRLGFVVGLLYPVLLPRADGLRLWRQHWRTYRQLGPLWHRLHAAFPADARNPPRRWDRWLPWRVHRRYWRRVIECRDGLVRLSPQLVELGYTPGKGLAAQAELVATALARHHAGHRPASTSAIFLGDEEGADSQRGDPLVALAIALPHTSPEPVDPAG